MLWIEENPLRRLDPQTVHILAVVFVAAAALFLCTMWLFYCASVAQIAVATGHRHGWMGLVPFVQLVYFARITDGFLARNKGAKKPLFTILSFVGLGLVALGGLLFLVDDLAPFLPGSSTMLCGGIALAGVLLLLATQLFMGWLFFVALTPDQAVLFLIFSLVAVPLWPLFLWLASRRAMTDLLFAWQRKASAEAKAPQKPVAPAPKSAGPLLESDDQLYS